MLQRSQSLADQSSVASITSYTSYPDEMRPVSHSFTASPSIVAEDNRLWLNSSPVPRSSSTSKKVTMAADGRRRNVRPTRNVTINQIIPPKQTNIKSTAYSHRVVTAIPTNTAQQFSLHNGHRKVAASDLLSLKSSRSADGRPPRHPTGNLTNSPLKLVQRYRPPSAPNIISRQKATGTSAPPFK